MGCTARLRKYVDLKNLTPEDEDSLVLPLVRMQAMNPNYDQSAGANVPEGHQKDFYHGTSHEGAVAIIQARALARGERVLENK